jgi:hypothetical protein
MKMPWDDRTGLAKITVIFSTVLTVSLGLCGLNFVAVNLFTWGGSLGTVLMTTGILELAGIISSSFGLLIVGFVFLGQQIKPHLFPASADPESNGEGTE